MKYRQLLWTVCWTGILILSACATDNSDVRKKEIAWRELGKQYYLAGDSTTALKYLLDAERLYPNDHILQNYLGQVYLAKGKPDLAVNHFKNAINLKPDYAVARNNLGVAYLKEEKWDDAIAVFKEVTSDLLYATPHYPLTNIGYAYYSKGNFKESEKFYLDALALESNFPPALRGLGRTYVAMGKGSEAIAALSAATDLYPEFAEAYYDLGEAYLLMKNVPKAKAAYEKVVQLKPDSPEAREAKRALVKLQYMR